MPAFTNITAWHWAAFVFAVLGLLALDLGVFHRSARVVGFREAALWSGVWFCLALLFGCVVAPAFISGWQYPQTVEFITGYTIELSLSMDNVFVIALIFAYFRVPQQNQHRVLFWGILGALVMRAAMILVGVALIRRFEWVLYILGGLLIFSGVKMAGEEANDLQPEKNPFIRVLRRLFPVALDYDGEKFVTRLDHRRALTPLALVLVLVETTDLIFATDSIPAIFAVTTNSFVIFTSNVFAILGLRSLYFVLAGAIRYFRHLKFGLSVVLVFIGMKMLCGPWLPINAAISLLIVTLILAASMVASVVTARRDRKIPAK